MKLAKVKVGIPSKIENSKQKWKFQVTVGIPSISENSNGKWEFRVARLHWSHDSRFPELSFPCTLCARTVNNLPEPEMATLRMLLQLLKLCAVSGLSHRFIRQIYKEEQLKHKAAMISRICEISLYSDRNKKFYYKKYKKLSHCESLDVEQFKKLMKQNI